MVVYTNALEWNHVLLPAEMLSKKERKKFQLNVLSYLCSLTHVNQQYLNAYFNFNFL